jgi:hypothetical protein
MCATPTAAREIGKFLTPSVMSRVNEVGRGNARNGSIMVCLIASATGFGRWESIIPVLADSRPGAEGLTARIADLSDDFVHAEAASVPD